MQFSSSTVVDDKIFGYFFSKREIQLNDNAECEAIAIDSESEDDEGLSVNANTLTQPASATLSASVWHA